jgi:hypothetical protein
MSIVDNGPGSFSVIDLAAATLLLVGKTEIRSLAEAVLGRPRGDQVVHRMSEVRRCRVPVLRQETTGRSAYLLPRRVSPTRMSRRDCGIRAPVTRRRAVVLPRGS